MDKLLPGRGRYAVGPFVLLQIYTFYKSGVEVRPRGRSGGNGVAVAQQQRHQPPHGFHVAFFQQFGLLDALFLVLAHVLQPFDVAQPFHGEHFHFPVVHAEIDVEYQADNRHEYQHEQPRQRPYRRSVFQQDAVDDGDDCRDIDGRRSVCDDMRPVHVARFFFFSSFRETGGFSFSRAANSLRLMSNSCSFSFIFAE